MGGAKGRDLDDFPTKMYMRQAKPASNQATVTKSLFDFLGRGIGGYVKILGVMAKQQITHATTDEVSGISGFMQTIQYLEGSLTDVAPRNAMFGAGNNGGYGRNCFILLLVQNTDQLSIIPFLDPTSEQTMMDL